ncbi:PEP-CTERM sorting domain-containing protein [Massilia aerilata]|uniref:PEP-CTERM sorting domain-containing protein n=1 Tax=Massilia aerilata TaxID=453817 RepID=A0ABW0RY44_9BURK
MSPHLKVNSFDGDGGRKAGSLLSENIPLAPVPEPSAYAMLLGGLLLLGGMARGRTSAETTS